MMKFLIAIIISVSLLFSGQTTHTVSGEIIDGVKNKKISFCLLQLLDASNTGIDKAITDDSGRFKFENVSKGFYSIRFAYLGYHDTTFNNINIVSDTFLTLNIHRICRYDSSINNNTCPVCKKHDKVIPIVYGLLISDKGNPMRNDGKTFKAGGCNITNCDPHWYCRRDKIKF